jgi:hypothetical protein
MPEVITAAAQVTPEWLTRMLYEKGYLDRGRVISVQEINRPQHTDPWFADIAFLKVGYSDQVPKSTPRRLCLKVPKPDLQPADLWWGGKEVEFYNTIASAMDDPPLAHCYDAVYDPDTGQSHVLLDDLSETHFQPQPPLPPSRLHCEQLVDCLARFHAHWWDHPRIGTDIGKLSKEASSEEILRYPYSIRETGEMFSCFVDFLGDRLSPTRRRLYERVLSSWPFPILSERLSDRRGLTLVHGDAHVWNFFYPRHPQHGRVCLIDWHEWGISLGTNDLAETIALWWYPERRARMEEPLLRRYHDQLLEQGVKNHDWEQCWNDYRLSVIRNLFSPVWMYAEDRPPTTWWPMLERALLAFQDLECVNLVG